MSSNDSLQPVVRAPGEGEILEAMGVSIVYKTVGADSAGQWLILEYVVGPQLSGPPPHVHKVTTEIFYVLEGTLSIEANGRTTELGPGGCAYVPPGITHTFGNPGDTPTKYLLIASPAGLENYFAEALELIKNETQWPPADMGPMVALMEKYDTFA